MGGSSNEMFCSFWHSSILEHLLPFFLLVHIFFSFGVHCLWNFTIIKLKLSDRKLYFEWQGLCLFRTCFSRLSVAATITIITAVTARTCTITITAGPFYSVLVWEWMCMLSSHIYHFMLGNSAPGQVSSSNLHPTIWQTTLVYHCTFCNWASLSASWYLPTSILFLQHCQT